MILVRFEGVGKSYGGEFVVRGVTFQVDAGQRVGIVGDNGAGKSTLFQLITGSLTPEEGRVVVHRGARIALLDQHPVLDPAHNALQEVLASRPQLLELESRVEQLAEWISHPEQDPHGRSLDRLLDLHSRALEEYAHAGGHDLESRAARALAGLGLPADQQALPIAKLSGGQRSRVALAKALLDDVDLLLLDEPTNHLDIQAIEWLQDFLNHWPRAFLAISHDRGFLDAVCKRILEVEATEVTEFSGNYTRYTETKELELASAVKAWELQNREIQRQEEWIRWRAAQATPKMIRMAKVRARALARMERLERPTIQRPRPALRFAQPSSRSAIAFEAVDVGIRFGERVLFRDFSLVLNGGNRLGLVGPNGSGKSTLVRILLGEIAPTWGRVTLGRNLRIGYYSQEREDLDPTRTVFDHLAWARPDLKPQEIRTFLGRFLFHGEDAFLPVEVLSGGERSRVALSLLILSQPDFLILDEPTNHLDIASCEVFEDALADYRGTILVVSHDRYFLDRTVDRLIVMGESQRPRIFHGNWAALTEERATARAQAEAEEAERKAEERRARRAQNAGTKQPPKDDSERNRRVLIERIEGEIAAAEARIREVSELLASAETYADGELARSLSLEYRQLEQRLDELFAEYEAAL